MSRYVVNQVRFRFTHKHRLLRFSASFQTAERFQQTAGFIFHTDVSISSRSRVEAGENVYDNLRLGLFDFLKSFWALKASYFGAESFLQTFIQLFWASNLHI